MFFNKNFENSRRLKQVNLKSRTCRSYVDYNDLGVNFLNAPEAIFSDFRKFILVNLMISPKSLHRLHLSCSHLHRAKLITQARMRQIHIKLGCKNPN